MYNLFSIIALIRIYLLLAPTGYPTGMMIKNLTSTMIHVQWSYVPIMQQLGKILDYNVLLFYQTGLAPLNMNTTDRYILFHNLKHFKKHIIIVKARNSKGFGPSMMILAKTREDGKNIFC